MDVDAELAEMQEARARFSAAVVESDSPKRLIVAGPGTGKTHTFQECLAKAIERTEAPKGLALTFIRNLADELEKALGQVADVNTFHGYSKHLMHQHVAGLQRADLYPLLIDLLVEDLALTGRRPTTKWEIEAHLETLDTSDGLIAEAMTIADYYAAVSFPDLVYRVLDHFQRDAEGIPEWPLVVVDEYQDFSLLETTFIDLLATKSPVLIAGDDDQALYTTFRHASPKFIRDLDAGDAYERFELPYCSRCTEVVVEAVNDVIRKATGDGHLLGRVSKEFICYLPDKRQDSIENPRLVQVDCSTANMPYAGQYIAQQIARIPAADIAAAREKKHPTVLVIGPKPFLGHAFEVVREQFPQARMKARAKLAMDALDGYERIARNGDSRLGWRILISCSPPNDWEDMIRTALDNDAELAVLLPEYYREKHLAIGEIVGKLISEGQISPEDERTLCDALGRSIDSIRSHLVLEADDDELDVQEGGQADDGEERPEILFTSLVGAKGLSAEHVFIVGLNNGHFPSDPASITDEEICSFLVALSRTRKRCHLISYRWFADHGLAPSEFLEWVAPHVDVLRVNKDTDLRA
jgi:superfamily I DNA/RNA helicase